MAAAGFRVLYCTRRECRRGISLASGRMRAQSAGAGTPGICMRRNRAALAHDCSGAGRTPSIPARAWSMYSTAIGLVTGAVDIFAGPPVLETGH